MRFSNLFTTTIPRRNFFVSTKIIGITALILFMIGFLFFIWLKVKILLLPPELYILYPKTAMVVKAQIITVQGSTAPGNSININDQSIIVDTNGNFDKKLNLNRGLNILKITASTKYNKTTTIERVIFVDDR